jgi:hypothetical protein
LDTGFSAGGIPSLTGEGEFGKLSNVVNWVGPEWIVGQMLDIGYWIFYGRNSLPDRGGRI